MIVVDASVLFDYQRGKDKKLVVLVPTLACGLCGTTRAESLKGCRTPAARAANLTALNTFRAVSTPEAVWDELGDHLAALGAAGITVPFPDVLVASVGIHYNLEVWARDQHFSMMQAVLPALRLFVEPP